jgi:branched-chain amino acid aminotransferase
MTDFDFTFTKTQNPKPKPDPDTLKFGQSFSDHMLLMDYEDGKGWHNARIVPFGNLSLSPAAAVLHYSQQMFEGLKAYRAADRRILLFRPDMNARRANNTSARMCIPLLPEGLFTESVKALVKTEQDWIPEKAGTSLYIRPFVIADEAFLGVHAAHHYQYIIICSPVGPYYDTPGGKLASTSIFVEEEYSRAAPGGTGYTKVGANYAASLIAQTKAAEKGCEQVLWLDATEHRYVEEIGTSNAFFKIGDEVITAPLLGTILPGVTRDSAIALMKKWGIRVSERRLLIADVRKAAEDGSLKEIFATGTAAVISPVGKLLFSDSTLEIGDGGVGELSNRLYETLYGVQTGAKTDDMNWTVEV